MDEYNCWRTFTVDLVTDADSVGGKGNADHRHVVRKFLTLVNGSRFRGYVPDLADLLQLSMLPPGRPRVVRSGRAVR